jgi:hypothetical protein
LSNIDALCAVVSGALQGIEILNSVVGKNDVRTIDLAQAETILEREEGGAARKRQAELQRTVADLTTLATDNVELGERNALLTAARNRDTALAKVGSPSLRQLYEQAQAVISGGYWGDTTKCPVCESKPDKPLLQHLAERIEQYAAADATNENLAAAVLAAGAVARLDKLEVLPVLAVPAGERLYASIVRAAKEHVLPTSELEAALARLVELDAKKEAAMAAARAELQVIERTLPPSLVAVAKIVAGAKQFGEALGQHARAAAALAQRRRLLASRERWRTFITAACEAFCSGEASLANARIAACQTEYQALFGSLIRGGPDVRPTLERASGSENVDLTLANFYGQANVNARAVLSESYRNAVAASIFFAAATKYNGAPRFVILDDVTSSFDAGHQFSLMEAIRTKLQQPTNATGLQFIILSHDTGTGEIFRQAERHQGLASSKTPRHAASWSSYDLSAGGRSIEGAGALTAERGADRPWSSVLATIPRIQIGPHYREARNSMSARLCHSG